MPPVRFASPEWLVLLALVPLLVYQYVVSLQSGRASVRYSDLQVLTSLGSTWRTRFRHVLFVLKATALACLVLAMATLQVQRPLGWDKWKPILLSRRTATMVVIVAIIRIYGALIESRLGDGTSLVGQMQAEIDGAEHWGKFRHITFPLMIPTWIVITILGFIGMFGIFDQVIVMGNPKIREAVFVVMVHIFEQGFRHGFVGYASAMSLVLAVVVLILTALNLKISRKVEIT